MKRRIEQAAVHEITVVATKPEHMNDGVARLSLLTESLGLDVHGDLETFALRVATQVHEITGTWPVQPEGSSR